MPRDALALGLTSSLVVPSLQTPSKAIARGPFQGPSKRFLGFIPKNASDEEVRQIVLALQVKAMGSAPGNEDIEISEGLVIDDPDPPGMD
jgi:hypothetical protein